MVNLCRALSRTVWAGTGNLGNGIDKSATVKKYQT